MAARFASRTIVPMKAKSGDLPRGEQWVYELKWDGMRVVAFVTGDEVRLQSSNGRDVTASFPELQALATVGAGFDGLVLDGEVVAFQGAEPSFHALQARMHVVDPTEAARRAATTPIIFVAFDLLHLDGHDTMALPLDKRRSLLEQLDDNDPVWTICEQYHGEIDHLVELVMARGLEGIVAKRVTSTYRPGRRSTDWVKYKPRLRQEFVVGGWLSGQGNRQGGVGSLLLGTYDDDRLDYAGRAGSGLTAQSEQEWLDALTEQAECPFATQPDTPRDRTVHWCEPTQVAEIEFGEWPAGQHVRHPVVLGRRTDKDPRHVHRER